MPDTDRYFTIQIRVPVDKVSKFEKKMRPWFKRNRISMSGKGWDYLEAYFERNKNKDFRDGSESPEKPASWAGGPEPAD